MQKSLQTDHLSYTAQLSTRPAKTSAIVLVVEPLRFQNLFTAKKLFPALFRRVTDTKRLREAAHQYC